MLPLFVQQHIQKVSHIFLCFPCFLPNSIAIFMEWNVSGMCTPVSAAAAAAKSLAKEKYWKGRGVWNIKRKQQLFIFFVWWCSIASLFLLMAFLSLSKKREMRQVVIF